MLKRMLLPLALLAGPAAAQAPVRCDPSGITATDSARDAVREAIRATLVTAARAAGIDAPTGLVVVMMDRDGGRAVLRAHQSNLPEGALAVAAPHVAGLAAAFPGEGRIRAVVRLDPLPLPACRSGRERREREPRFSSPEQGRDRLRRLAEAHAGRRVGIGQLVLYMAVTREGELAYVEVESGEGEIIPEDALGEALRGVRMRPAALDGVPQDLIVGAPMYLRVEREGGSGPMRNPGRTW